MRHRRWLAGAGMLVLWWSTTAEGAVTRYVSNTAAGCGAKSPCHGTIQAAVNAAEAGDTIEILPGTYPEQVSITGKNNTPAATEASRILVRADPSAPPGSVILRGAGAQCTQGYAIQLQRSRFITIRGLVITGAIGAGISLLGGNNQSQAVHIERNRIVGNGGPTCNGGIVIARGNRDTRILNNLVHGNGRNGITMIDGDGGPHDVIGNTIHGNGWDGVQVGRNHDVLLANNAITGNGAGAAAGHVGISREDSANTDRAGIQLLHNLVCGNRSGEIRGPVLDSTDSGNLTPTGLEGPGVAARAGCDVVANVYAQVAGLDGRPNTPDDHFVPAPGSPLIDGGIDPRTLGLPASLTPLLEADFLGPAARPQAAGPTGAALFDIGAIELSPSDTGLPAVSIVLPPAGAVVRGEVTVSAEARDDTGIAALSLRAGAGSLTAELTPPPPAAAISATAPWDTAGLADGTHTLTADTVDLRGNLASAQRVVMVDNTPPDTTITEGPTGTLPATSATIRFAGSDNVSAPEHLVFAWRLDAGPFGAFAPETTATLVGLATGPHTFEVKARDRAGNVDPTPARRTFAVSGLELAITEPLAGAVVAAGPLLVRGTVAAPEAGTGVTVNGVPAAVHGSAFAAVVQVGAEDTALTAVATVPSGATATSTIAVTVTPDPDPALPPLWLTSTPAGGVAPLEVSFSVGLLGAGSMVELDLDGDGAVDFTGPTLDGLAFTYAQPGVYIPVIAVTDGQGLRLTATTVVQVTDAGSLDTRLRATWTGMKDALRAGDIAAALTFISSRSRAQYHALLQVLSPSLASIDSILTDISVDQFATTEAFYAMERTDDGLPLVFEVRFAVDDDGVWRIRSF